MDVRRMRVVSDPVELDTAWGQQYERLSREFSRILPSEGRLVDVGCGEGQLTILLAENLPRLQIIGVDTFRGPYSESQAELRSSLTSRQKKIGVRIVVSDYYTWLRSQSDSKYDSIISSEFLPELDSRSVGRFFTQAYRTLKPGGITIHSFLSPRPRNARQRRLIEADSDPRWTKTPPAEWFSPSPKLVLNCLRHAGLSRLRRTTIKSGLVIRAEAAKRLIAEWDIRQSYWKSNRAALEERGLEIPDWEIIRAQKSPERGD